MGYPLAGMGYPPARSGQGVGYPLTGMGYPLARSEWGGTQGGVPPSQARMGVAEVRYPQKGWGTPLWYRTADGVLDTSWSVCLLHSSRRTVLFEICFQSEKLRQ